MSKFACEISFKTHHEHANGHTKPPVPVPGHRPVRSREAEMSIDAVSRRCSESSIRALSANQTGPHPRADEPRARQRTGLRREARVHGGRGAPRGRQGASAGRRDSHRVSSGSNNCARARPCRFSVSYTLRSFESARSLTPAPPGGRRRVLVIRIINIAFRSHFGQRMCMCVSVSVSM